MRVVPVCTAAACSAPRRRPRPGGCAHAAVQPRARKRAGFRRRGWRTVRRALAARRRRRRSTRMQRSCTAADARSDRRPAPARGRLARRRPASTDSGWRVLRTQAVRRAAAAAARLRRRPLRVRRPLTRAPPAVRVAQLRRRRPGTPQRSGVCCARKRCECAAAAARVRRHPPRRHPPPENARSHQGVRRDAGQAAGHAGLDGGKRRRLPRLAPRPGCL